MPNQQPRVPSARGNREFTTSPAAVVVFLIDEHERLLLFKHPGRTLWEVVSGALEAGETVWEGALREVREEAGPDVLVEPLGALHTATFRFDDNNHYMLSLSLLMACRAGSVIPGDDMAGSEARWFTFDELDDPDLPLLPPTDQPWLRRRALALYRLWQAAPVPLAELQRPINFFGDVVR
ncbi:MAG: NUDIX domain-containing protein [Anaerolineae bacterium]|nr:MAG: NUDIX domain-containing protein [Anaerolineae bacterium]